ncbi:MAG: zinc transporter ZupT [Candidatus Wallbacteria bacterium GWC2_49_35]|uniref:Zinc transporter ZupT n=1 Tax=Candidatus Wallbacteria bacterium GWC2_49_35 TaxID=1817813 RepID=A0A1F7X008_9BACT|nr:MAG: zinc transporter ZupT [Candidatus Wallbacteria bacterium GWC2_49_35]HBC74279.1 zinc transporter ZupT [Candidatus Wallbacteria bacterium]
MNTENVLFALGLTVFAGLATGIGSAIAFFAKKFDPRFLSGSLGFSAGVMIYVSFVEIFAKAKVSLEAVYGPKNGYSLTVLSFFIGMAVIALIDKLVPSYENPHETEFMDDMCSGCGEEDLKIAKEEAKNKKLLRMGMFSALAIAIHNFPEGLATFIGGLQEPGIGVGIAFAIAIHNIPEGIAVSVPIYYATKSRKKAFFYSFMSGLSEPVGALIGYFLLLNFFDKAMFGYIFASVAGIMVYISLDELLPTAEKYGEHHIAIYGLISGMAVMAISLLLFA